jgi:hypothetical protein
MGSLDNLGVFYGAARFGRILQILILLSKMHMTWRNLDTFYDKVAIL